MKKLLSLLLSIVVICSCFSCLTMTSVSALDSRIENALQWAVNIANDNSHGYSWDGRWGPDYDCSSLVISAFKNAGFNVGSATYTGNMRKEFEEAGFTWIPKSQINLSNSSQLQRGDILLDESAHTEIYLGNGQNVGAHRGYKSQWCSHSNNDGKYHRHGHYNLGEQKGDQDGGEISVAGYYNYPWDGVLRYQSQEPPSIVNLQTSKTIYGLNDTLEFNFSTNVKIDYYKLQIWKGNLLVYDNEIYNDELTLDASDLGSGNYTMYASAVNSYGSCKSSIINFSIADKLTNPLISINNTQFSIGDTIVFNVEVEGGVDYYGLQIWKGDRVVYEARFTGHTVSVPCSELGVGDYGAFVSCVNPSGAIPTDTVSFRIGSVLTNPLISINKSEFVLDKKIVIQASADGGVDYYGVQIWKDTEFVFGQEFIGHSIEIPAETLGVGTYDCFVSCVNCFGYVVTETIRFNVVAEDTPSNFILGDVDGNGDINIMDVTEIQRHIAQLSKIPDDRLTCADTDKDGIITITDATQIQRFIAQLIPNL